MKQLARDTKTEYTKPKYIKVMSKDMTCRDMKFELGEIYTTEAYNTRDTKYLCSSDVVHFVDDFKDLPHFYACNPSSDNRYFEVEPLGTILKDGNKCGSDKIKIVRELSKEEVNNLRNDVLLYYIDNLNADLVVINNTLNTLKNAIKKNEPVYCDDFTAIASTLEDIAHAIPSKFSCALIDRRVAESLSAPDRDFYARFYGIKI